MIAEAPQIIVKVIEPAHAQKTLKKLLALVDLVELLLTKGFRNYLN